MIHKINSQNLKKIIREQVKNILHEEVVKKELEASLDKQVDNFLISYESESSVKNEGFNFRSAARNFLSASSNNLFEAEGDEAAKDKPEEKKMLTIEDIDVEEFASNVVRQLITMILF